MSESHRKIIHVDMDAFFASVEQRDDPSLKGLPVVVGGSPRGRGVVAAASYEARVFGIHSAMPCAQALRLCPGTVFVRPDIARYRQVSLAIREIFRSVTALVEPLSLDEAYLDVTSNHLGERLAGKLAIHIKRRIHAELGLTASAGVGPNKFIAKVASNIRKPDGLTIIPPDKVEAFVAALKVEQMWGVGPATARKLHSVDVFSGADLRTLDLPTLKGLLGKQGAFLYGLARGRDPREVTTTRQPKSRGAETTFGGDILDVGALVEALQSQCQEVTLSMTKMGRGARTVTIKVRYDDFTTVTRSHTLRNPTEEAERLRAVAVSLLRSRTEAGRRPVRLVGVSVSNFTDPDQAYQLGFEF